MLSIHELVNAFHPKNMFSTVHYLRRPRIVVFQLTTLLTTASGAVSSYALNKFVTAGDKITNIDPQATLHNSDIKAAGALTISAGAVTGTLCGVLFLILLLRPTLQETHKTILVKEVLFGLCTVLLLAASLFSTIVAASHAATISGVSPDQASSIAQQAGLHLEYKKSAAVIAFVVIGWLAFAATAASFALVSLATRHDAQLVRGGPNTSKDALHDMPAYRSDSD